MHNDFEHKPIPRSHREGFLSMFLIMMGYTFFSAAMLVGGKLGVGMTMEGLLTAVVIGITILVAYTGVMAWIAGRTKLSLHLLSRYAFGENGSHIPSFILAVTQTGWFGVGLSIFAIPVALVCQNMPIFEGTWFLQGDTMAIISDDVTMPKHLLYSIVIAAGVVMTSSAYWGIRGLSIVSGVAVPSIVCLGLYSVIKALFTDHPVSIGAMKNGWEFMLAYSPRSSLELSAAVSIVVGAFISGGTCTPDITRYARSARVATTTTVLAYLFGATTMFLFGAVGAIVYNQADISLVLEMQGLLGAGIVVLSLNVWTTNDNTLYTSGLGLANITGLPKRFMVLLSGFFGTFSAVWIYNNLVDWLNILNTVIPPIGAVLIVDYFCLNTSSYSDIHSTRRVKVRWTAVAAWACGAFVALLSSGVLGVVLPVIRYGVPAVNGMIVTVVAMMILQKVNKRKR